jgi:hypothetical protein
MALGAGWVGSLAAQQGGATPDLASMLAQSQRATVSRAELQRTLDGIEQQLSSGGYSSALRSSKQAEADRIRERLTEGDLRVGDIVGLQVVGDETLSKVYQVTPDRTIQLPQGIEISVKGVLRSEMQDYMTGQLKKYIRDPVVRVTTGIRLQLTGAVGKSGIYNAPAGQLLSDFLMTAGGGIASNVQWKKSTIMRADKVIVEGPEFDSAVRDGKTLDELNLRGGDAITVAAKPASGAFFRVLGVISGLTSLVWIAVQIIP